MAEGSAPIVARIVIDGSGISGLGGGGGGTQDPENTKKRTNKNLKELLGIQKLILAGDAGGILKKLAAGVLGTGTGSLIAAVVAAGIGTKVAKDMTIETLKKVYPGLEEEIEEFGLGKALLKRGWKFVGDTLIALGDRLEEDKKELKDGAQLLLNDYGILDDKMSKVISEQEKHIKLEEDTTAALKKRIARIQAQYTGRGGGGGIFLEDPFKIMEGIVDITIPPPGFEWIRDSGTEVE